ncbi:COMM domain-containing protein 4-like [Daphnia pulicaria]|uniref:COMM domain-containing protein 4-like n=1 Tax=Daphnia pulicaria TaxID=35523 RepID=UPI001EEAD033|nr:COMM domain-containing protein 4-like [Daphnia pulicaria]XP_046639270.1 COMM domain-containing protein 4-like [Daphnia pulicaria]
MKFRFCGDSEIPDWLLTQMATLSRLSSVKAKLLTQHVARHLSGQGIDLEKSNSLLADSKLPESDVKSLLGSIQFVLTSASRFSTGEDHLRAELQQVGLPREHAAALAKVYHDNADSIRKNLIQDSLMMNKLQDITWRIVDGTHLIELTLHIKEGLASEIRTVSMMADPAKLQTLLYDMERVRNLIAKHGLADGKRENI